MRCRGRSTRLLGRPEAAARDGRLWVHEQPYRVSRWPSACDRPPRSPLEMDEERRRAIIGWHRVGVAESWFNRNMAASNDYMPHGMADDPTLALLAAAALFLPLCYYIWKIYAAVAGKSSVSAWPPIGFLLLWLLQWPAVLFLAMSRYCEDCGGKPITSIEVLYVIGVFAYNIGPAAWLWFRSAARRTDA